MPRLDRRDFVRLAAGLAALPAVPTHAASHDAESRIAVPDEGWRLLIDRDAPWRDDDIFLPDEVSLASLPVRPPTGGWEALADDAGITVTLPATVEQHYWGAFGARSYTPEEYAWAAKDPVPQNGAYEGVSWWWRALEIPARFRGRRILLSIRGARMRAEVYLNRKKVGYSILEELPFECDLTAAAAPGGTNLLAIRITNPGGRYDWLDGGTIPWGKVKLYRSHGFGGLDRGMALEAHPMEGRIADLWVLNTPDPRTVHAFVKLDPHADAAGLTLDIAEEATGSALPARIKLMARGPDGVCKFRVTAKRARLWTLAKPALYRLRVRWKARDGGESVKSAAFGFRWFAPEGVGKDAMFRLNGRRIRLYSAISWGYWGMNGLWPTPDLAEKEAAQAKALGLNCLSFHRNLGKEDVFAAQDRMGLLRIMEPGGGKFALGRLPDGAKLDAPSLVMQPATGEADCFAQRFMLAKCTAMVRAFRSHPSLVQYTLQNEVGADLDNPDTEAALEAMRAEDESRSIVLNDGFVTKGDMSYDGAAQAWFAPYDPVLRRSDREPWGGWWDDHQGAGDQWYDEFYRDPAHFTYRRPLGASIVEFGEMEGCATPDSHGLAIADILQRGGKSYDLADRREILAAYDAFLDRWGFRAAFPTADKLFAAIGRKAYESWQQYLENARLNDATDLAAISGWESTAIENHSGLVDNLRNFKSDPALIRASLLPVRPVAKQRSLVVARGERALFDLYLLNDTGAPARGTLTFAMTDPTGRRTVIATFDAPAMRPEQFSTLIKAAVASPPLAEDGLYRFEFSLAGHAHAAHRRDILAVDGRRPPAPGRTIRLGMAGAVPGLAALAGVALENFTPGTTYSLVVATGALPPGMLAAARDGTPLLVLAYDDEAAEAAAKQLAGEGAFTYNGQVGRLRAPWMGSWYFLRPHPVYAGLPTGEAMGMYYQAHGDRANGLLVEGPDVDVFAGYGRDHDRRIGAGTFTAKLGGGRLLFQRVPPLNGPMQQRFLSNAVAWLCDGRE